MVLEISAVKRQLQDHLQEGLLLVVGSGLSIAEGIPGMGPLAEHLKIKIPSRLILRPDPAWDELILALEKGDHLEAAMGKVKLQQTTVEAIVEITAKYILSEESVVFESVLSGSRTLPFTTFVKHLFKAGKRFHLITPNYDRLIELATEAAGIGVDSRFFGYLYAQPDPKRAADCHRESYVNGKNSAFRPKPCLCLHKPHGSLDWFEINGNIVRCPIIAGKSPIIITPGASKYRESFRWAFDDQRTSGNQATAMASRLMFLGYGFNDDHLEQYLCPGLKLTKSSVILAKELSTNAKTVIKNSAGVNVLAISAVSATDPRTKILSSNGEEIIVDEQLWNLEGFNKGVL